MSNEPPVSKIQPITKDVAVPSNAVVFSKREITDRCVEIVNRWNPRKDMYAFTYGTGILGASAAASGLLFNSHFRSRFRLRHQGRMMSFLPTVLIPAVCTITAQYSFVSIPVLIRDIQCPICIETRAALIQMTSGVAQPFILGLSSSLLCARQFKSTYVPKLNALDAMKPFLVKHCKPLKFPIAVLIVLNALAATISVEKQIKLANKVWMKLEGNLSLTYFPTEKEETKEL